MKIYAVYRLYCVDQTICFKVCNTVLLYAYTALYREMFWIFILASLIEMGWKKLWKCNAIQINGKNTKNTKTESHILH